MPKPMEKQNIQKKKSPHVPGPASQALSMGPFFFWFSRGFAALSVQECQLLILLCFPIFLILKNINWQIFQPCTYTLMSSLSYWLWLVGHQRKRRGNHLYHPPLQVSGAPLHRCFFWYAYVMVPHVERFDSCSLIYLSQSVRSFEMEILCPSQHNLCKEGCCVLRKATCTSYSSWWLLHDTYTACPEEMMAFVWTNMFILKVSLYHLTSWKKQFFL